MSYVLNLQKMQTQFIGDGVDGSWVSIHCSSASTHCDVPRDPAE
jgi:hypothetical protein